MGWIAVRGKRHRHGSAFVYAAASGSYDLKVQGGDEGDRRLVDMTLRLYLESDRELAAH